jgi:hypothetical protein
MSQHPVPTELANINAPHLEEWSLVGCGVNDQEFEAIAKNILAKYQSILLHFDLSHNQLHSITAHARQYFHPKLRILILDGNPMISSFDDQKGALFALPECQSPAEITIRVVKDAVKDLLQCFPYLGYLGKDFDARCAKNAHNRSLVGLQKMMRDNRHRSRLEQFRGRIMNGGVSVCVGSLAAHLRTLPSSVFCVPVGHKRRK